MEVCEGAEQLCSQDVAERQQGNLQISAWFHGRLCLMDVDESVRRRGIGQCVAFLFKECAILCPEIIGRYLPSDYLRQPLASKEIAFVQQGMLVNEMEKVSGNFSGIAE